MSYINLVGKNMDYRHRVQLIFKRKTVVIAHLLTGICVLGTSISACGKSDNSVAVGIHAVNYSASELTYRLEDPQDSHNVAGGESIGPFSAGGTVCCYRLPKIWRSDMAVRVVTNRLGSVHVSEDEPGPSVSELVKIPRYLGGKAGELWLIVASDGKRSLVLSELQPDHPGWPGQIKGWPIPSAEYKNEIRSIHLQRARSNVALYQTFLKELESDPDRHAVEAWEDALKYEPEMKSKFSGPDDPKFRDHVRSEYTEGLARSKARLRTLEQK